MECRKRGPKPRQVATCFLSRTACRMACKLFFVLGVHLDVAEHREIVAAPECVQMRLEISGERLVAAAALRQLRRILFVGEELNAACLRERVFGGQRTVLLVFVGQLRVAILLASTSG